MKFIVESDRGRRGSADCNPSAGLHHFAVWCGALLLLSVVAQIAAAQSFEYKVRHRHIFRDCRGVLKIGPSGAEYAASVARDSRRWKFEEIHTLEVTSPTTMSLITFEDQKRYLGKDRVFEFELEEGEIEPDLSAFLLDKVGQPMVLAVFPKGENAAFQIKVKHLHTIAGAMGTLLIFNDRVEFQSALKGDSRLWRLSDIERFSQPDKYRFQIVSSVPKAGGPTEVFNFQLLDELPGGVYDFLWTRLHPSSYYPKAAGVRPNENR